MLDNVDEKREAELRMVAHQKRVVWYFNSKVHCQTFEVGDLVLKRVYPVPGAFEPNWERLYVINQKLGDGTLKPTTVDGIEIRRAGTADCYDVTLSETILCTSYFSKNKPS